MAEVIQFHCPACCVMLSIPLVAAGKSGPCPNCNQPIMAPEPATGRGACRLAVAAPEPVEEPPPPVAEAPHFEPFHGVPAAPPEPIQPLPPSVEVRKGSTWYDVIGVGIVAATLGFAAGYQSTRQPSSPLPPPVKSEPAIVKEAPVKPAPVLSAAKSALGDFLAAADWKSRSKLVLFPETILPRMERFHEKHPDGPTEPTRLGIEHCEASATTNLMLVVFRVHTATHPTGFPVAVSETPDGWKVDWQSFVEFKDELFVEFVTGKATDSGSFHLLIQPSTEPTETDDRITYILSDPVKQREFLATVRKGTDAAKSLADITKDGVIATPVVELSRLARPDGTFDLEIIGVPATNWRPVNR
ncbi:MAG: hypothetical protein CFE26_12490 [Verrucomicrobiales bacterium VVV1]|nr:MAG: hypothetical protein CFE26_12490 [Verrucomicrobiales bacterium VVV1]